MCDRYRFSTYSGNTDIRYNIICNVEAYMYLYVDNAISKNVSTYALTPKKKGLNNSTMSR